MKHIVTSCSQYGEIHVILTCWGYDGKWK